MLEYILQSEIEFHEAYQDFINYKNICEIVTKAKASSESLAFASSLLNTSVENIQVSVEGLREKFKAAWNGFVAWWKRLIEGFKDLKAKFNFSNLPTLADISRDNLRTLSSSLQKIYKVQNGEVAQAVRKAFSISFDSERLENKTDLSDWIRLAENVLNQVNLFISSEERLYKNPDLSNKSDEAIVVMRIVLTQGRQVGMKLTRTLVKMKKVKDKNK